MNKVYLKSVLSLRSDSTSTLMDTNRCKHFENKCNFSKLDTHVLTSNEINLTQVPLL